MDQVGTAGRDCREALITKGLVYALRRGFLDHRAPDGDDIQRHINQP